MKEKIDAVRALRGEQEKEMKGLKNAVYLTAENDVEPKPLGDFLKKSESRIDPMMGTAYHQVGVKWWGEGALQTTFVGQSNGFLSGGKCAIAIF